MSAADFRPSPEAPQELLDSYDSTRSFVTFESEKYIHPQYEVEKLSVDKLAELHTVAFETSRILSARGIQPDSQVIQEEHGFKQGRLLGRERLHENMNHGSGWVLNTTKLSTREHPVSIVVLESGQITICHRKSQEKTIISKDGVELPNPDYSKMQLISYLSKDTDLSASLTFGGSWERFGTFLGKFAPAKTLGTGTEVGLRIQNKRQLDNVSLNDKIGRLFAFTEMLEDGLVDLITRNRLDEKPLDTPPIKEMKDNMQFDKNVDKKSTDKQKTRQSLRDRKRRIREARS